MDIIVYELLQLLKSEMSLIDKGKEITAFFTKLAQATLSAALGELDDELSHSEQSGIIQQKKSRTLVTAFGEVTYVRRYYVTPAGQANYFALDDFLGIMTKQRVTPFLRALIARASIGMTNRHEAEIFSLLLPVTLSHQAINRLVRATGNELKVKQEDQTVRAQTALEHDALDQLKQVPSLVVTADALLYKEGGQEVQHASLHRVTIHEGSQKIKKQNGRPAKKRRELKEPMTFSATDRETAFWLADVYLHSHYDLTETVVITNSDNGSGYTPDKFERFGSGARQWIHQLDHFHVRRKVGTRLGTEFPLLTKKLVRAIFRNYDFTAVQMVLTTIESILSVDPSTSYQARQELVLLEKYLSRNWDSLRPLSWYGSYRDPGGLGTSESGHRKYSYRLKGQGRYWSKNGAEAQARIIDCVKNQSLESYLELPESKLKRAEWHYDGRAIQKLLHQSAEPVTPHVGVVQGLVELNGHRYYA